MIGLSLSAVIVTLTTPCTAPCAAPRELSTQLEWQAEVNVGQLEGAWVFDLDFLSEYLHKGAELQKLWCGYGWSESEVDRREKFLRAEAARNGDPVAWEFRAIGKESIELRSENNRKESTRTVISNCRIQQSDMIACAQSPRSALPFVIRLADNRLSAMLKMTPGLMSCQIKSASPTEVWIPFLRFKRKVVPKGER